MSVDVMTGSIVDLETPVELPAAAPIHVRAAAIACVYAIDELASRIKTATTGHVDDSAAKAADRVITEQRRVLEREGWKLLGIGEISDGSRGWRLVAA